MFIYCNGTYVRLRAAWMWQHFVAVVIVCWCNSLMPLSGGQYSSGTIVNTVWWSTTMGTSWNQYPAPFTARYLHSSTTDLDNYVYVYGGQSSGTAYLTDLWYSTNPTVPWYWLNIPLSSQSELGLYLAYIPNPHLDHTTLILKLLLNILMLLLLSLPILILIHFELISNTKNA